MTGDAAWLLVPAALTLVVFVWASLRALQSNSGELADRIAEIGFYACLFMAALLLFGLMAARYA